MPPTDFNPNRLTTARVLEGLTKKKLAALAGVSAAAISHFESGRKTPGDETRLRLAEATSVRPEFFAEDDLPTVAGVFFRRVQRTPVAVQRRYEHLAALMATALQEAGGHSGDSLPRLDDETPAEAALTLRAHLGLQMDEPIYSAVRILEFFGVFTQALGVAEDSTVDACSTTVDGQAIAFLNPVAVDPCRTRHSALHELFHIWGHDKPETEREAKKQQEAEANDFAGELLLPTDVWAEICPRHSLNNPWTYLPYRNRYGISVKSLMRKTNRLGLLRDDSYRYAMMRYSKLGWNSGEPDVEDIEIGLEDEVPAAGNVLLEHFGSVEALARLLNCGRDLAADIVGQPRSAPEWAVFEGGRELDQERTEVDDRPALKVAE